MVVNGSESFSYSNHCRSLDVLMNFERTPLVYWSNLVTCILNAIFSVTAVTGNTLVLIAILSSSMRTQPSKMILCSLASADLLVGSLVQPLYVVYKITEMYQRWDAVCYIKMVHVCIGFATTGVSLMSLMAIAVDRLLAVHLHLRYNELVTTHRVRLVIAALWIISILNIGLRFVEKNVFQAIVFMVEILSIIIATAAYQRVYKIVQRHRKDIGKHISAQNSQNRLDVDKYQKSAMTMFLVFMISLLCYLPFSVYIAFEAVYGFTPQVKALANIATTIICIISSCNPCIYCFRMHDIRSAVLRLLRFRTRGSVHISTRNSTPKAAV